MNKVLVICGPTASGKTKLADILAKKFNGEIVSADSRQVYQGMNIGTGKDLPGSLKIKTPLKFRFRKIGYFLVGGVRFWGYDLADPKKDYSVSHYLRHANSIIIDILKRNRLPILVGGTGFYIKALVDGISTAGIPRNVSLRKGLMTKSVNDLFETLASIDPTRAASMNLSDKKNPRRLVRAIEVAQWSINHKKSKGDKHNYDTLFVGLRFSNVAIKKIIKKRVDERVDKEFEDEVKRLLKMGVRANMQSMQTFGYREWLFYLDGKISKDEAIKKWINEEIKYAKKQMTWFKKDMRINWFDINDSSCVKNVELLVKKWYKKDIDEKN